ncbi:MAG: hypothetical protein LBL28_08875 [Treponema sp.]|nr:hypothetical protein [Treponema sp.]
MGAKKFVCLVLFAVFVMSAFPGGRKDNESYVVETPEGFTESIDIENKKAGKYNFYFEAQDKGGNTTIVGPDNIYIDPESDLPVVNITNPRENMRVQGNLNIVGTCVDDDAVDYVELWFNDDPDTTVRAEGAEFWSYYFETVNFPDKLYTISARGVDINGLPGREIKVNWNLDRKKPEAKVLSHELGALVAGRIVLKGTAWDGNGLHSLAYSLDGGSSYVPLSFKYDRKNDIYNYELKIDTGAFEDGPAVIWFQMRDKMGSLGAASHLVFVDNTGPDVQIVYPETGEPVNGIFSVAGSALDTVGLASLSWKLGKESGEFQLTTGNPWWVKEFDIRGQKTKSLDFEIRALDLSGNLSVVKRKIPVDQDADLPLVTLQEPLDAAVINADGSVNLRGFAGDDDGVAAILYSLDGEPALEIPSSGSFQFTISGISAGIHNLEVWARDTTGIEGPRGRIKGIVAPGAAPDPLIAGIRYGSGKTAAAEDFYTGRELNPESGAVLGLLVNSGSALTSLSWRFGRGEPVFQTLKNRAGGEYRQDIPLPDNIPYGLVKLELRAVDIHGREGIREEYLYITDLSAPNPDDVAQAQDNSSYGGLRLESLGGAPWRRSVAVSLARGSKTGIPVTASFTGEQPVKSAVFTVGGRQIKGSVKASPEGGWQLSGTIPPDIPAGFASLGLEMITRTNETMQVSGDFFILRPADDREINTGRNFLWTNPGGILDGGRILVNQAERPLIGLYSGRPLRDVELSGPGAGNFQAEVDPYGRLLFRPSGEGGFGPVSLSLTDKDGLVYESGPYNFLVDLDDPRISLDESPEGQWVQNEVGVKFSGGDANRIRALDVSFNLGDSWRPLVSGGELEAVQGGRVFERTLDLSGLSDGAVNVYIRIIDEAGRAAAVSFIVQKDTTPPESRLIVPVTGARVNGKVRVGIALKETGRLASIMYHRPAGGGEPAAEITKLLYSGAEGDDSAPLNFLDVELEPAEIPLAENMSFVFEDLSGNRSTLDTWPFVIDNKTDIPVIEIGLPLENEIITADFVLSGIMYDDDAVKQVYWRVDDGEDQIFEGANGYSIPIPLLSLSDNEHTITVSAEDIYGARSAPVSRAIRVSLEEPKAQVSLPTFSQIVKENVMISGVASDENSITGVQISLDSGNSYNDAFGTTDWSYQFNSKILKDGTHVVFIRVWDGYDITALYSSLINIDNTAPEVVLETPVDGLVTTGDVYITGRAIDAVLLETINIEVRSLEGRAVPQEIRSRQALPASILMESLDFSSLSDGIYNIEVWAEDKAGNINRVSRNVELRKNNQQNFVDNLYPLNGEHVRGMFNLYGYVGGIDKVTHVTLSVNEVDTETVEVTEAGFYRFALSGENLTEGLNGLVVRGDFGGKEIVQSSVRSISYRPDGAWVTIDSLNMGDFAYDRPWLSGRSGYALSPGDEEILADKKADKELRTAAAAKKLKYIDLSFDNGRTFVRAEAGNGKDSDWRYRLETGEMIEGLHYLIVRAVMENGETAVTRTLIQADKTPPWIRLVAPQAGGRYNQSLEYTAFSGDDIELKELSYYLRKGDKAFYGVPGFLQGLYVETTIPPFVKQLWNGWPNVFAPPTYMDLGLGLSFFDDNVKVQLQYGFMTEDIFASMGYSSIAYAGNVLGLKLLANLYTLPLGAVIGPDWEWLFASFGLGANFSLFSQTQSESPTWMSALLFQMEFPKVSIPKQKFLRTFSLFTEYQMWFRSTDVPKSTIVNPEDEAKKIIMHIVLGLRMYIF